MKPPSVLTIAGSDCGGGAGIQADLKTFAAHGVHGLSAIAALTAQNTRGVSAVHVPPVAFLRAQLDACFDDFNIHAVKIGMLASREVIACVAAALQRRCPRWVVLDPVMVATSGATLLDADALDALRTHLLPLADVLTPNLPEAELLLGRAIGGRKDMTEAARTLRALGASAVLLKGGHLDGSDSVLDLLDDHGHMHRFEHPRLALEAHGTGCTLAAAVAARLARGEALPAAVAGATDYVHAALLAGSAPGQSALRVLDHMLGRPPAG